MTKKERIQTIVKGKIPDYTPHHFDLTLCITDIMAAHYGYDREGLEEFIGNHLLQLDYTAPGDKDAGYRANTAENAIVTDEFGVEWDMSSNYAIGDWGIAGNPVKDLDFSRYAFPDGRGEGRFERAKAVMADYPDRFNVLRINGPFDFAWHITGLEDFLVAMASDEKLTFKILDKMTEFIVNIIAAIPEGVDAVRIIEDWGIQKGLLFSKRDWMKYIYPCYKEIHDAIRRKNLCVMHHSCGDITELFPEIIELGTEIIDALQPEAMDVEFIKREYGKDIVLFGALGSQSTIPTGTPEQVIAEAERTLEVLGREGKYIIGPAGSIPSETPLENVIALVEFCQSIKSR
ncbi:MAG: hypothetical protein JXA95_14250 [Spirochaetales bacterium]|nr:hypothetical protein [Spirochaetales bacterium]